jgi:hypothetical protein
VWSLFTVKIGRQREELASGVVNENACNIVTSANAVLRFQAVENLDRSEMLLCGISLEK